MYNCWTFPLTPATLIKRYYIIILFSSLIPLLLGDSTDQEYEITADMMVHDMDDETTMDEEELMADKEEFNEDELSELQKVSACKMPRKHFKAILN